MPKPKIEWVKNDPKKHQLFTDGSVFLVSLQVKNQKTGKTSWEFDVVKVTCDDEWMTLDCRDGGCGYSTWEWSDFEYFALLEGEMPSPSAQSWRGK